MWQFVSFLIRLFAQMQMNAPAQPSPAIPKPPETVKEVPKVEIDWTNPKAKISKHFTVKEACYLPSWNCYHLPTEEEKANIIKMAQKMDIVRDFLGKPISVHCWLRPGKVNCPTFDPKSIDISDNDKRKEAKEKALEALDYNAFVGGASRSAHKLALAMDFDCGEKCDETRLKLEPKLEEYDMRMEQMPGGNWVHLDMYPKSVSGGIRFFKP